VIKPSPRPVRGARAAADDGLAHQRRQSLQPALEPLTAINRANVAQLKGVARASARLRHPAAFALPRRSYNGVAYISTGANDVFALSIDTGELLWQWASTVDPHHVRLLRLEQQGRRAQRRQGVPGSARRPPGGARSRHRQAGLVHPGRALAENFSITAAPLYAEGMVIVGLPAATAAPQPSRA
jgi:hypothetical protein